MDMNTLFFSIAFSIVGIGYFSYGKKQNLYFMLSGIALITYPYFINGLWMTIGVGIFLVILPILLDRFLPL